jgi:HNH endonuclease
MARDSTCVLTGKEELDCDACHIVPLTYFQKNDFIGKMVFDTLFPYSCEEPEHRVMDVRNGLLMWHRLNAPFDKFQFTIIKKAGAYVVETLSEHEFPEPISVAEKKMQLEVIKLDGKKISFNDDKQNEWPAEKFLQFHNQCFYKAREDSKIKGVELNEEDSGQTIAERSESVAKVKSWFSTSQATELSSFVK